MIAAPVFDLVRRARLRALLARSLTNGGEVWQAYRVGGPMPPLEFRNGATLHHGAGDAPVFLFFEIFANGCYRRQLRLPIGGTVVDIGANIGAFTIDLAMRHPEIRIDAYEPNPAVFRTLEANVAANGLRGRVRLYNEAVGRARGLMRLWPADGNIAATAYPSLSESGVPPFEVAVTDLPTVVARTGAVAVLKIDAEGAEADILEGGRHVLTRIEQIVAEYHEARVPDVVMRMESVLREKGFRSLVCRDRRCGPLLYASRP